MRGFNIKKAKEIVKSSSVLLLGHINDQRVCSAAADLEQVASQRGLEAPPASGCSRFFHLLRVLTDGEVNNQRRHAMLTRGRVHGRW